MSYSDRVARAQGMTILLFLPLFLLGPVGMFIAGFLAVVLAWCWMPVLVLVAAIDAVRVRVHR